MENTLFIRLQVQSRKALCLGTAIAVIGLSGCNSGVAPSRTASGAGTGALIGGLGGAAVGSQTSMGGTTGGLAGAAGGAIIGGIVGMVQESRDRKEQDRLSQERAYQQENARKRADEMKLKAAMDEELEIAQGMRISDIELDDANRKLAVATDKLKKLEEERSAARKRKKDLDDANEKTLVTEANIAKLEEELARLRGDNAPVPRTDADQKKSDNAPGSATTPQTVKPGT